MEYSGLEMFDSFKLDHSVDLRQPFYFRQKCNSETTRAKYCQSSLYTLKYWYKLYTNLTKVRGALPTPLE
jgi:hypothetical protein